MPTRYLTSGHVVALIAGATLAGSAMAQELRSTDGAELATPYTYGSDIVVQDIPYEEVLAEFDLIGNDPTLADRMKLYRLCTLQCAKDFPPKNGDTKDRQACIAGCAVVAAGG